MDHVVYLDAKAKEFEKLINGTKTMIIRGATGRKLPHGRVFKDDILYFINNNGEGSVKLNGKASSVFCSKKLNEEESISIVKKNQEKLQLTDSQFKKWAGKRYLVLIEINDITEIELFEIDKTDYSNMDDWLLITDIHNIRK